MLEDIVVSHETAKKLKAAGWNKTTEFIWIIDEMGPIIAHRKDCVLFEGSLPTPAPTAEEILRELPIQRIDDIDTPLELAISRCRTYWYVGYAVSEEVAPYETEFHDVSLSEAAAQMWLWCKENGYL